MLFPFCVGAVHHWDENGLPAITRGPEEIYKIHQEMIAFVGAWSEDFRKSRN